MLAREPVTVRRAAGYRRGPFAKRFRAATRRLLKHVDEHRSFIEWSDGDRLRDPIAPNEVQKVLSRVDRCAHCG